jgi:hypothetical protein
MPDLSFRVLVGVFLAHLDQNRKYGCDRDVGEDQFRQLPSIVTRIQMLLPDSVIIPLALGGLAIFGMSMEALVETTPAGTTLSITKTMGTPFNLRASTEEFPTALVTLHSQLNAPKYAT